MKKRNALSLKCSLGFTALALLASACGPQAFVPSGMRSRQSAAGSTTIPAKVDIVFGISQNQTMLNIYPGLQYEIPAFLQNLQNNGWDYRFIGIPLGSTAIDTPTAFPITGKVSVSRYDNNTPSANWLPPYPGAVYTNPLLGIASSLVASAFTYPAPTNASLGIEYGLKNQFDFVTRSDVSTDFLRPDAVLAMINLSNGEDRSWATAPPANTAQAWAYDETTTTNKINTLLSSAVKPAPAMVKYYAMVAHLMTSCRGYGAWSGIRYENYASRMNGRSVDICTVPLNSALSRVSQDIQGTPLPFRRNFLVIETEPNPATIQVIKYTGGNTNAAVTIPQDATNGWSYSGYLTNQYTIDSPIAMDQKSGYMIELHGTAKLNGSDTADVLYQNTGTVSSY